MPESIRSLVLVVHDPLVAETLAADFRWPLVDDVAHAKSLAGQGFSLVAHGHAHPGEESWDVVVVEDGMTSGDAHQLIHAVGGLDPLRLNADLGVFAWTLDDEGQVLMVRNAYGPRMWGLPGGTVELFEGPDRTVVREVKEETGIDVAVERMVACYGRRQHIGLYFRCKALGGELRDHFDTEVADVGWFPADALPQPCSPVLGLLAADLAEGKPGSSARFF